MRVPLLTTLGTVMTVALVAHQAPEAQFAQARNPADSRRITVAATTPTAVSESTGRIARMVQAGDLASVGVQDDAQLPGRQTQTLQQIYRGIPVEGGSVTLQRAGTITVSVFGTLFEDVSV